MVLTFVLSQFFIVKLLTKPILLRINSEQQKKMIDHGSRFRENDDLLLWRGPAVKKKPPFSNARTLMTCKIMRSRDAQSNTGE